MYGNIQNKTTHFVHIQIICFAVFLYRSTVNIYLNTQIYTCGKWTHQHCLVLLLYGLSFVQLPISEIRENTTQWASPINNCSHIPWLQDFSSHLNLQAHENHLYKWKAQWAAAQHSALRLIYKKKLSFRRMVQVVHEDMDFFWGYLTK